MSEDLKTLQIPITLPLKDAMMVEDIVRERENREQARLLEHRRVVALEKIAVSLSGLLALAKREEGGT